MVATPSSIFAQELKQQLDDYFQDIRNGQSISIPDQLLDVKSVDQSLIYTTPYLEDTLAVIRYKAYMLINMISTHVSSLTQQQKGVALLVKGTRDEDSGNAGAVLEFLKQYHKEAFTTAALDSIKKQFTLGKSTHQDKLIKLAGYLELTELTSTLRQYAQPGVPQQTRWAALVALARMQDQDAVEEVLRRTKKLPINDDIIHLVFPDLVYTRQRPLLDYMITILQRNTKDCSSANPEREEPIVCGYRIMEQLAPAIENYPLTVGESGDIETNDYKEALVTVRFWLNEHKDYGIRRDTY